METSRTNTIQEDTIQKDTIQKKRQIQLVVRDRMNSICPMKFFRTTDTTDTTIWKPGFRKSNNSPPTLFLGRLKAFWSLLSIITKQKLSDKSRHNRPKCFAKFSCIELIFFCPWETTVETIRLVLIQTPPPRQVGANINTGKKEIFFLSLFTVYMFQINQRRASFELSMHVEGEAYWLFVW